MYKIKISVFWYLLDMFSIDSPNTCIVTRYCHCSQVKSGLEW